jgi:NTP pyrophosphatase (non-canonical NTP hydrolase)
MLDLREITRETVRRCEAPEAGGGFDHPLDAWSVLEWAGAAAGEAGEAANVAKKMSRFDYGFSVAKARAGMTRDELKKKLAQEMADTFHYHLLLAASEGIDFEQAIRDTFNNKSVETGWPGRI